MKRTGRSAVLARRHEVKALQPLVQGDIAALHDRFRGDTEILAAFFFRRNEAPVRLVS